MDYWKAPEVEEIVEEYMKHHPTLVGAKFACLFKERASTSDGRPVVGRVNKVTNKYKPFMDEDYVYMMVIGADVWMELDQAKREAWVDNLMEHCYGEEKESTGEMKWKTRNPEVMGFPSIIRRHGIDWNQGLQKLRHLDVGMDGDAEPVDPKKRDGEDVEEVDQDDEYDDILEELD